MAENFDDFEKTNDLDEMADKFTDMKAGSWLQSEAEKEHLINLGVQEGVLPDTTPAVPITATPNITGPIDVNVPPLTQIPTDEQLINSSQPDMFEVPSALASSLFAGSQTSGSMDTPLNAIANGAAPGQVLKDIVTPLPGQRGTPAGQLPPTFTGSVFAPGTVTAQDKIGSATSLAPSNELDRFNEAQQKQGAIVGAIDIATKKQLENADALAKIAAPFEQMRADRANLSAQRIAEQNKLAMDRYEQSIKDVDRIRNEMAQQDWSSYWGSRTVGDRIILGLALGLGAYGQSKIGGKNVAQEVLNSIIEDHDNSRKARFNALRMELSAASTSGNDALRGAQELAKMEGAAKLADYEKISEQYNVLASKVKTEDAKQKIILANAEVKQKILNQQANLYAQMAGHSIETKDILSAPTGYTPEKLGENKLQGGKLVPMTEAERTNFAVGKSLARINKDIESLEDDVILQDQYAIVYDHMVNEAKGIVAENLTGLAAATRLGQAFDSAAMGNPGLLRYGTLYKEMINLMTREQTGAAMAPSELSNNAILVLPKPPRFTGSAEATRNFRDNTSEPTRRDWVRRTFTASGTPLKPYFDAPGYTKEEPK